MQLTPDEQAIRDAVASLASRAIPKFQHEQFFHTVPRELWAEFAKAGLTGITISPEFGGTQLSMEHCAAVYEEISQVDVGPAIVLAVHNMVSGVINRLANSEQKAWYLPKLASGELLAAFALTEPGAGSDARALSSRAVLTADTYSVTGEKCYITSAGFADLYLLFAKDLSIEGSDSISAFMIPSKTEGVWYAPPDKKMGAELSPIASLTLTEAQVPQNHCLGQPGFGFKQALTALQGGRVAIAACAVGISKNALNRAVIQLQERIQFGAPLYSQQGLQFMIADLAIALESAALLTRRAAQEIDADPASAHSRYFSSIAKCGATDTAMRITTDVVQLFGGAGYLTDYGVEKLMRDAKMLQIVEGTNQIQRGLIAKFLPEQISSWRRVFGGE